MARPLAESRDLMREGKLDTNEKAQCAPKQPLPAQQQVENTPAMEEESELRSVSYVSYVIYPPGIQTRAVQTAANVGKSPKNLGIAVGEQSLAVLRAAMFYVLSVSKLSFRVLKASNCGRETFAVKFCREQLIRRMRNDADPTLMKRLMSSVSRRGRNSPKVNNSAFGPGLVTQVAGVVIHEFQGYVSKLLILASKIQESMFPGRWENPPVAGLGGFPAFPPHYKEIWKLLPLKDLCHISSEQEVLNKILEALLGAVQLFAAIVLLMNPYVPPNKVSDDSEGKEDYENMVNGGKSAKELAYEAHQSARPDGDRGTLYGALEGLLVCRSFNDVPEMRRFFYHFLKRAMLVRCDAPHLVAECQLLALSCQIFLRSRDEPIGSAGLQRLLSFGRICCLMLPLLLSKGPAALCESLLTQLRVNAEDLAVHQSMQRDSGRANHTHALVNLLRLTADLPPCPPPGAPPPAARPAPPNGAQG